MWGNLAKKITNLAFEISLFTIRNDIRCRKILRHGAEALLPIRSKVCSEYLPPLKIYHLGRVWTHFPWVQWQARYPLHHRGDSHTTTELTDKYNRNNNLPEVLASLHVWFHYKCDITMSRCSGHFWLLNSIWFQILVLLIRNRLSDKRRF
jgi:hypothetical protein